MDNKQRYAEGYSRGLRMERLMRIRGFRPVTMLAWTAWDATVAAARAGDMPVPTNEEIDAEAKRLFPSLKAHPECEEFFIKYGALHQNGGGCDVCGTPLMCAGVVRRHSYKELTPEEKSRAGIYTPATHHVMNCTVCGDKNGYDSGD